MQEGHSQIAKVVLEDEHFTEVNAIDKDGENALHLAAYGGPLGVTKVPLGDERFTEVNANKNFDSTALLGQRRRVCSPRYCVVRPRR